MISVRAPSNIALIKYMGKRDSGKNIPENPSISMTLDALCTVAELTPSSGKGIQWVPELPQVSGLPLVVPALKDEGIGKVVRHLERVRSMAKEIFPQFGLGFQESGFVLKTANTFPPSSGIASSASSFAAMTLAAAAGFARDLEVFDRVWNSEARLRRALARVSRQGSGSSCRSFDGPWVFWELEDAVPVQASGMPEMAHFVILVKTDPKRVSSSEAHSLVRTSPLWDGRVERVETRTRLMMAALEAGDLVGVARIAWSEAWEMHSLFHTCAEPFSYWEPGTIDGLHWFAPMIRESSPPIVTLDAGPNIHVIVEKKFREEWRDRLKGHFAGNVILEDQQGKGASLIR